MKRSTIILLGMLLLVVMIYFIYTGSQNKTAIAQPAAAPAVQAASTALGSRTKTTGCVINGKLPDSACTPGAAFSSVTKQQVCSPGYSRNVRNVTAAEKRQVYAEYGILTHQPGEYEVDHLVSLELGGSNDIANLWPEAASPAPGFHQKDVVENYLHSQVCKGLITLAQAQQRIAGNWFGVSH